MSETKNTNDITAGSYDFILLDSGSLWFEIVPIVEKFLGIDETEADELVRSAPTYLKKGISKESAENFKKKLGRLGSNTLIKDTVKDPDLFDVILENAGKDTVKVITSVKNLLNLGLMDAKRLVDKAPVIIRKEIPTEIVEIYKSRLEPLGATLTVCAAGTVTVEEKPDAPVEKFDREKILATSARINKMINDAIAAKNNQNK